MLLGTASTGSAGPGGDERDAGQGPWRLGPPRRSQHHQDREGAPRMSAGTAPSPLKIGLYVPFSERQMEGRTPRWADILAMARRAEDVGFDSLWVPDHLIQSYEGVEPRGGWECWTLVT